jgi:uncharacterized protein YjbI with pentapeptide repeats
MSTGQLEHLAARRQPAAVLLEELGFKPSDGPAPGLPGKATWWDLRGISLRDRLQEKHRNPSALRNRTYYRVAFGDSDLDERAADLTGASFVGSKFEHVSFPHTLLIGVSFRECEFVTCDFRHAHIRGTSFRSAEFTNCDFYRAFFEAANIFEDARLLRVSLDNAWLTGFVGLTMRGLIRSDGGDCSLIQECKDDGREYRQFLTQTAAFRPTGPKNESIDMALLRAKLVAANTYRALSATWAIQGQYSDAGAAYLRRRNLEREYYDPRHGRSINKDDTRKPRSAAGVTRWLGLTLAWALANYGLSMKRVAGWLLALIVIPGIAFSAFGGVETTGPNPQPVRGLPRCLLFSLEQLTASVSRLQGSTSLVDLVGSLQVFFGITLIGLFGFTLASWLRNA